MGDGTSTYRERIFRELRFEFLKKVILESVLDTGIVFLFTYLILSVTRIPFLLEPLPQYNIPVAPRLITSLLAAFIFFGYDLTRRKNLFSLQLFGTRDKSVVEMLQTAKDNLYTDNTVVRTLFQDLGKKLGEVSAGETFSLKQLTMRFLSLTMLAGLVVVSGLFTYTIPALDIDFNDLPDLPGEEDTPPGQDREVSLDENASIYGDAAEISGDGEELELELETGQEAATGDEPPSEDEFNQYSYPVDTSAVGAGSVPEEEINDFELAKQYSLRIRGNAQD